MMVSSTQVRLGLPALLLAWLGLAAPAQDPKPPSAKELLERIRREREDVPVEVFEQLGARGDRAGLDALTEGITLLDDFGALRAAHDALGEYAKDPKLAKPAVGFLVEEMKQPVLSRRWAAPRTLVAFGEPGLEAIEEAARKSPDPYLRSRAVEALLPELRRRGDADALELIFASYEVKSDDDRAALAEALADFRGKRLGRALGAGLADRRATSELKCAVVIGLIPVAGADIDAAMVKALSGDDTALVVACIEALGARGYDGHARVLKKLAKHDELERRYAAIRGLVGLPKEDAKGAWTKRLHAGLDAREEAERRAALAAIVELRRRDSIPALIAALEVEEDAGMQAELVGALRDMTGLDHGTSAGRWASWWEREGVSFVLPQPAAAAEAELERKRAEWRRGQRYDFYGLKVESLRVCFVLDASGSMKKENEIGISRFEVAKRYLTDSLARFPDGGRFNVLFFGSRVEPYARELVEMTPERRAEVAAHVEGQKTLGTTAIYDALREAFRAAELDTLYLLSDGSPLGGEIDDVAEIRAQVAAWNRAREVPVTIHCVAAGGGHRLLEWLAQDSGGRYVLAEDD